jgi:hypothetical protein
VLERGKSCPGANRGDRLKKTEERRKKKEEGKE